MGAMGIAVAKPNRVSSQHCPSRARTNHPARDSGGCRELLCDWSPSPVSGSWLALPNNPWISQVLVGTPSNSCPIQSPKVPLPVFSYPAMSLQ